MAEAKCPVFVRRPDFFPGMRPPAYTECVYFALRRGTRVSLRNQTESRGTHTYSIIPTTIVPALSRIIRVTLEVPLMSSRPSFQKRQKEQARKEKQRLKQERKQQRKLERDAPESDAPDAAEVSQTDEVSGEEQEVDAFSRNDVGPNA
jgi:hypothetical protein